MKKIHKLSPLLISKIAAGEVIERPSFAIKELIENAIDAKATEIKVYIEEAGLRKIQVSDNGIGMAEEDLLESWKPHTTSKIKDEDELHSIQSLGFRGEALASLSAVSRLSIKSRVNPSVILEETELQRVHLLDKRKKNDSRIKEGSWTSQDDSSIGVEIIVENGKFVSQSPVGMAPGTVVTSENIFASVPARKKFLKSPQTELRHCIDTLNYFAVAYPKIKFSLIHNKRTLIDYPISQNVSERIEQLVGADTFSFFIPVKKSESYVGVTGFIAKPQMNSTTTSKQFLFVNSRKVADKLLALAVKDAFGTMLEATTYPLFVLFITLPYEMLDVNVHPRKEQVSFVNNQFMYQTIRQLISDVLQENNLTFQNLSWKRTGAGMTKSYAGQLLKEKILDKESLVIDTTSQLLQLNKLYIVATSKSGLVLVDQHAAHERVLFEKLKTEFLSQKEKTIKVKLEKPISLNLTQSEMMFLKEHIKVFEDLGFQFYSSRDSELAEEESRSLKKNSSHKSSNNTPSTHFTRSGKKYLNASRFPLDAVTLTHLPSLFQDRDPHEFIKTILEDVENKGLRQIDTVSEEMLAFLACRAAVKAGDALDESQMRKILEELEITEDNITCPHGRPTRIEISLLELHKLFKRM